MTPDFSRDMAATFAARKVEISAVLIITMIGSAGIVAYANDAKSACGLVAALVVFMAGVPYIITIFRGETTPNRASTWIWAMLSILMFFSYQDAGAEDTKFVPLIYIIDLVVVAVMSIKYGEGGWNKFDVACTLGAITGIALWRFGAAVALLCFIIADLMGALPTLKKSWLRPKSEDHFAWTLTFVGNSINIFAANKFTVTELSYPVYAAVTSGLILCFLLRRKQTT